MRELSIADDDDDDADALATADGADIGSGGNIDISSATASELFGWSLISARRSIK